MSKVGEEKQNKITIIENSNKRKSIRNVQEKIVAKVGEEKPKKICN